MPPNLDPDKLARMQAFLARQTEAATETEASESTAQDASPDPVPDATESEAGGHEAAPTPAAAAAPRVHSSAVRPPLRFSDTLTYDGLTLTLTEWAARLGINPSTIHARLRRGFPVEQVLHVGNLPRKRRSTRPDADSP